MHPRRCPKRQLLVYDHGKSGAAASPRCTVALLVCLNDRDLLDAARRLARRQLGYKPSLYEDTYTMAAWSGERPA